MWGRSILFVGHAWFYQWFRQNFSKIVRPLCQLIQKEVEFEYNEECLKAFHKLKELLTISLITKPPDWNLQFKLRCDVSNYTVRAVLGKRVERYHIPFIVDY